MSNPIERRGYEQQKPGIPHLCRPPQASSSAHPHSSPSVHIFFVVVFQFNTTPLSHIGQAPTRLASASLVHGVKSSASLSFRRFHQFVVRQSSSYLRKAPPSRSAPVVVCCCDGIPCYPCQPSRPSEGVCDWARGGRILGPRACDQRFLSPSQASRACSLSRGRSVQQRPRPGPGCRASVAAVPRRPSSRPPRR